MVILLQMLGFLLMLVMGLIARRVGILTSEVLPKVSSLVANVTFPCMIIASFTGSAEHMGLADVGRAFFFMAIVACVLVVGGWVLPRLLGYPAHLRPCANICFWLTNIGYMGMALLGATFGDRAKVYVLLYMLPNNFLLYTYAIWLLRRGTALEGGGEGSKPDRGFSPRSLVNPGLITTVGGGILYFAGVTLPDVLLMPLESLGNVTVPLAMMIAGAQLADMHFGKMLLDRQLVLFCVVKMLLVPIAVLLALRSFVIDIDLLACCMAVLAMPTGVMISSFALIHQPNAAQQATSIMALTTVISVITVPLVCLVAGL